MSDAPRRNVALDVLRGVAVLLVILFHAGNPDLFPEERASWFQRATSVCWCGVDLFFVLSGFLISGLLFSEIERASRLDVRRFWLRRGMKIWPSYFAAYGGMVAINAANMLRTGKTRQVRDALAAMLPNVVFIQNYTDPEHRWPNSWSLAVEEHFYLVLPGVLLLLLSMFGPKYRFRGLFAGGAVFCAVVLGLRLLDAQRPFPNAYNPTHLRADSLCFGVMIGYAYRYKKEAFARVAHFWPLAFVLAPLALVSSFPLGCPWPGYPPAPGEPPHSGNTWSAFTIGFTFLYLGSGALVAFAAAYPKAGLSRGPLVRAPLRAVSFLGVYSYTVYLAQAIVPKTPGFFTLAKVARRLTVDSLWTDRVVFVLVSFVLGVALSHVVERPFLVLRDRFLPSSSVLAKARA